MLGGLPRVQAVVFASPPGENGDHLDVDLDKDAPLQF
jgi:hypothetical protein